MRRSLAALAVGVVLALSAAGPASAESKVTLTGGSALSATPSELTVTGAGFQSIDKGFGGIYVMFGWVDAAGWRPSEGGVTGTNYRYAADDETNPVGLQRFLAFPGGATSAEASGTLAADGTFSTTITTPGAEFTSLDRNRVETRVDCLEVQCGIITIGAHGVVNPSNETFTPVSFAAPVVATPTPSASTIAAVPTSKSVNTMPFVIGGVAVLVLAGAGYLVRRRFVRRRLG